MFNRVAVSDEYKDFQAEAETADGRSAAVFDSDGGNNAPAPPVDNRGIESMRVLEREDR